jgi:hypothetical protein
MVNDDFSALDLLSIGGYRLSSTPKDLVVSPKKKRFGGRRRPQAAAAKRGFAQILPMIGRKLARPASPRHFQGWSMRLSWAPGIQATRLDLWKDQDGRPLS